MTMIIIIIYIKGAHDIGTTITQNIVLLFPPSRHNLIDTMT